MRKLLEGSVVVAWLVLSPICVIAQEESAITGTVDGYTIDIDLEYAKAESLSGTMSCNNYLYMGGDLTVERHDPDPNEFAWTEEFDIESIIAISGEPGSVLISLARFVEEDNPFKHSFSIAEGETIVVGILFSFHLKTPPMEVDIPVDVYYGTNMTERNSIVTGADIHWSGVIPWEDVQLAAYPC